MKKIQIILLVFILVLVQKHATAQINLTPEFAKSQQLTSQKLFNEAIAELRKLKNNSKYSEQTDYYIGMIQLQQAEFMTQTARSILVQASESINSSLQSGTISKTELPHAYYKLALLYQKHLYSYFEAIEIFQKIVSLFPDFILIDAVYYNIALCHETLGEQEEALEAYNRIVTNYSYSSYYDIAASKVRQFAIGTKLEKEVIKRQETAVSTTKTYKDEAVENLELAKMYENAKQYHEAAEAYQKTIDAKDDKEALKEAYIRLIDIKDYKLKEYQETASLIESFIADFKDDDECPNYIYRLARLYDTNLTSLTTTLVDGKVRYRKKTDNINKAIEYYNSITESYPHADITAEAFLRKGELYEKELKDNGNAKASYEKFIRLFPTHRRANEIKEKVQKLK